MASITKKSGKIRAGKFYTLLAFFAAAIGIADAQTSVRVQPPVTPAPAASPVPQRTPPRVVVERPVRVAGGRINNDTGIPAEKALAVDAKVNVQFCVNNGNVKVSGWDRNEVRAMVEGGSYVGFRVLNKTVQAVPAVVKVVGYDTQKTMVGSANECLRGETIIIDVPRSASVAIKGGQYDAEVSSVYKAEVINNGGDISLSDVSQGASAKTYQGDLKLENAGGAINLETTNGNIFAYNVKPIEFSNFFSVKTNSGAINLQAIDYPQIGVKSISGAISFSGSILSGGQYSFETQNGSIQLMIPKKSSFAVAATYGYGSFNSDFQMTNVVKTPGQPQKLTAQTGAADATLTLSTFVGSINIKTN